MQFHETYAGVRVLDLSENIAGPLACLVLADLGADVVKIERPPHGDATRSLPPYWNGEATVFQTVNRNKRSAALDLKSPAGREAVLRLAADADVVVESFRPGVADRLGLGYDDLVRASPRLVHVSVNAFGTGPLGHDRPGYDALIQAFTGIMEMTGEADGGPVRTAPSVIDVSTGLWVALAIQAALVRRAATDEPQRLEGSLVDTGLFLMGHQVMGYLATGTFPPRLGSAAPSAAPYQVFSTTDRPIMIATSTDRMFVALCRALGLDDLATDPDFSTMDRRLARRFELAERLQVVLATRGSADWLEALAAAGVPAGPVHDLGEALAHPLTAERGLIAPVDGGSTPDLLQIHLPMDRERSAPRRPAPRLGEHTAEVLGEVGLRLDDLTGSGEATTTSTRGNPT